MIPNLELNLPHKRGYPVPNKLPKIYCVSCPEISVFPPVCMKYGPNRHF